MSSNILLSIIKPISESFLIPLLFLKIYVIKINLIWLWGNFPWWQHSNKCISHHVINSNNWHLYSLKANVFGFVVTIVINQLKTWIWINIGLDKKDSLICCFSVHIDINPILCSCIQGSLSKSYKLSSCRQVIS